MSEVAEYFFGRSILVTGAYGFMGKVLLEKLLYACPNIKNIYIMVRPKRGKSIELRLEEMLKIPVSIFIFYFYFFISMNTLYLFFK